MRKTLRLQPRLELLALCVPKNARLADVGTDHGYVPVWLLQRGVIRSAIASDIGREPLAHARHTAIDFGVEDRIDFRLCAGLDGIEPSQTDTILIAGMGAETIVDILSAAPWTLDGQHLLILQPQTKTELLRDFLAQRGYEYLAEHLVRDKGTLYVVMLVRGGSPYPLTQRQKTVGVLLRSDPLFPAYLEENITRIERTIAGLRCSREDQSAAIAEKQELLEALIAWKGGEKNDTCS